MELEAHLVLMPLMSPGHLIPMFDMARLLSQHGARVTVVTTPGNAARFGGGAERGGFEVASLEFPWAEAGLPEGCENMESLSERRLVKNFYEAAFLLQKPFESLLRRLQPPATCVISGKNLGWTADTCRSFGIPRIFFDGMGCFSSCCTTALQHCPIPATADEDGPPIVVPGIPHRIELTASKLPENLTGSSDLADVRDRMRALDSDFDGIVVNSSKDLEGDFYVDRYKKQVKGGRVWCIGPVSSVNVSDQDKSGRGGGESEACLKWLDSQEQGSVVYACLGSICGLTAAQMAEVGLGLEASGKPFVWAVRGGERSSGLAAWVAEEGGFGERTRGKGRVLRGWAAQLAILSHPAVGAFLTHCGWNSTVEGLSAGLPLVTCPLFAEQFLNEKLVVEVLRVGVSAGVEGAVRWGAEERAGLVVRRDRVKAAVEIALDAGEEASRRRDRAKRLSRSADAAVRQGGSSFLDTDALIHFVRTFKS